MLRNNFEAQVLVQPDAGSIRPRLPSADYLSTRYPDSPMYPVRDLDDGSNYAFDMPRRNDSVLRSLARRFPAVLVNRMLGQRRVFVTGEGFITLRWIHDNPSGGLSRGEKLESDLFWLEEDEETFCASYRPLAINPRPADRQAEEEEDRERGGIPDLNQMPNGIGDFTWSNPEIDQPIAEALGYHTPEDILRGRQNGEMDDMRDRDRPRVVFWPDLRFFQPSEHPEGEGHWEFMTTHGEGSARGQAALNFGNNPQFFQGNPSAREIWELRQYFRNRVNDPDDELREDPTEEIELVWIPGGTSDNNEPGEADHDDHHDEGMGGDGEQGAINHDEEEPVTPTNQTPTNRARISQTDASGGHRHGKVTHSQPLPYTDVERRWLFEDVVRRDGSRATVSFKDLAAQFNSRFGQARTQIAIDALYGKLCREFREHGREFQSHVRGSGSKKRKREVKEEDDEEDEEQEICSDNGDHGPDDDYVD